MSENDNFDDYPFDLIEDDYDDERGCGCIVFILVVVGIISICLLRLILMK